MRTAPRAADRTRFDMTKQQQSILDVEAIIERLPHRFPFLLVDRVLEVTPGDSIVALKNVSANESHFSGHFPGHQVMPGVLVIEALAQAGGVLAWESSQLRDRNVSILYLVGIDKARFKLPVKPGDQLILKAKLTVQKRGLWRFDCVAEVDGQTVAEAELLMVVGKNP
jgi:3-hydroxyacyl-[acyl-carrier-protein] dehydratase